MHGENSQIAIVRVRKDVGLLRKSRENTVVNAHMEVTLLWKIGEMAIVRVRKDERLPRSEKMSTVRPRKGVSLRAESGEMTIVRVRKEVRLPGNWLSEGM